MNSYSATSVVMSGCPINDSYGARVSLKQTEIALLDVAPKNSAVERKAKFLGH